MMSLRNKLSSTYYVVSYLDFVIRSGTSEQLVNENVIRLQEAIKQQNVVFIDWEHDRVLRYLAAYNFIGFRKILGEYHDTNRWAISVPTFGHNDYGARQINNLDFLIYVNKFNKDLDIAKIDHSKKTKDFVYLAGKSHPHRVHMLKELLYRDMLSNSIWSASSPYQLWNDFEKKLDSKYEISEWQGKSVNGYDNTTRQVHHPLYNDSICTLVPETLAENDCHYITEKTCKPIMAEHIFVMLSGAGFLKNLRSLGFKTFHEHFDESYDECQNLNDRVQKIIDTLQQIKKMDVNKLYDDTKHIRQHNRELFFNNDFYNKFNTEQIAKLKTYFEPK